MQRMTQENPLRTVRSVVASIAALVLATALHATPVRLRCEYLVNPLGIDKTAPRMSWQSDNSEHNWKQAAYEILVASDPQRLSAGSADVWDSGKVVSDDSVNIAYAGPTLASRHRYYWKVRVWDAAGQAYESAESAWWEMGLLQPADWKAKWITRKDSDEAADRAKIRWIWVSGQDPLALPPKTAATFRTNVHLDEKPRNAQLFVAAHGDFSASVNGHEVDSKARWGAFDRRDIADQLVVGDNAIEVKVVAPDIPQWGPNAKATTTKAALAALVKITRANGNMTSRSYGQRLAGADW